MCCCYANSVTRFAEAHREIALAAGEAPSLRGFPPSTAHQMAMAERAGPGNPDAGDIAGEVFTVLVAGSDVVNRWPTSCAVCWTGM